MCLQYFNQQSFWSEHATQLSTGAFTSPTYQWWKMIGGSTRQWIIFRNCRLLAEPGTEITLPALSSVSWSWLILCRIYEENKGVICTRAKEGASPGVKEGPRNFLESYIFQSHLYSLSAQMLEVILQAQSGSYCHNLYAPDPGICMLRFIAQCQIWEEKWYEIITLWLVDLFTMKECIGWLSAIRHALADSTPQTAVHFHTELICCFMDFILFISNCKNRTQDRVP